MYEGNMRKNMYVENVEERECLEKTLKHLREGMLGGSMEENVCFGENIGERVCLERGCVWRNICIGERVGKEKRRGLMEIT